MHVTEPPPRLPAELAMHQHLLNRMLAKDPAERFQSAAELCASISR